MGGGRGKGLDEVDDDGALCGGEVAVPVEVNGDVSFEEWTLVVLENNRFLLNQSQLAIEGCGFW